MSRPPAGWIERLCRRLLRLALRAWPRRRRRSHGPALLETAERMLRDARRSGPGALLRETCLEGAALVREGLGMRLRERAGRLRDALAPGGWRDGRHAVRSLARSPGFSAAVVVTLALGLGGNVAVFSMVDAALLRTPPYGDPDELVLVWNSRPDGTDRIPVAGPDVAVVRERSRTLEGVAFAGRGWDGVLSGPDGRGMHLRVSAVSPDFFDVLGVAPVRGRAFTPDDVGGVGGGEGDDGALVAILSHRFWRERLAGDPGVVGRTLRLGGRAVDVVGVAPAGFALDLPPDAGMDGDVDAWIPIPVPLRAFRRDAGRLVDQDSDNAGAVIARLAPAASLEESRRELAAVGAALRNEVPEYADAGLDLRAEPLHESATAHARPLLLALFAGTGLVLLVACLNVATLVLARVGRRRGEMALRAALGAGRGRLARQLLAEGLVLAGVGALVGLALAGAGVAVLSRLAPPSLVPEASLALDGRALAFAAGLALLAAAAFAAAPLAGVGITPSRALAGGGAEGAGGRTGGGLRRGLIVGQVAVSLVLVLGAGLLVRSVDRLRAVEPGFEPAGALTFRLSLRLPDRYPGPADRARVAGRIEDALRSLPGVTAAGLVGVLPLSGDRWVQPWGRPGQEPAAWGENRADFRVVTSGYFEALGIPLLEGRSFTPREDRVEEERVVVVDRALAEMLGEGTTVLDAALGIPLDGSPVEARIAGVVGTVRDATLEEPGRPTIYVPYRQEASRDVFFVVRADGDPAALAPAVRRAVAAVDPELPVFEIRTLSAYVDDATAPRRFGLALLSLFAALALLSAGLGLYGVVSYEVGRRTSEMGLRMALGAGPARLVREVLLRGLRLGAAGIVLGAAFTLVMLPGLRALVWGVEALDPAAWLLAVGLVVGATFMAVCLPAWRASRLDPSVALRED